MHLSQRISGLDPSPTVALNAKAKELSASGRKILNFAVGEPDFGTDAKIIDCAVNALKAGKTKYGPAGGGAAIRQAIVDKLARDNNLSYKPDEIVVGIGAKEILFHIFLATLNEGDEVLVPAPYWVSYTAQIKAAGAKPVVIPFEPGQTITAQTIEKYASDKTAAIVINSPSNPSGAMLAPKDLKVLGEYLSKKDWWIVGDEIYEYLSYTEVHESLPKLVPALKDRYLLVNGMSKGFAMTGWRVGYLAGPKEVTRLVKILQSQSSTCLPPFIEEAATLALGEGKALMTEKISALKARRDLASSIVKKWSAVDLVEPAGAFYLFLDIRETLGNSSRFDREDSMSFSTMLLEEYHVAMVPGEAFGTPGFLRLSYAVDEEDLKEGLEKLHSALTSI